MSAKCRVGQMLCVAFVVCVAIVMRGFCCLCGFTVFVWLVVLVGQMLCVAFVVSVAWFSGATVVCGFCCFCGLWC